MNYLYLILITLIVIYNFKYNESFYGMNYIQQHAYYKCCARFGCKNPICNRYLHFNASPLKILGFIYEKGKSNGKMLKLFSRKNLNTNRDEYFIKYYNTNDDYIMKKINITYLYNGDEIEIDNKIYTVSFYENNGLPIFNSNINNNNRYYKRRPIYNNYYNRFVTDNIYSGQRNNTYYDTNFIPYNYNKHGYIQNKDKSDYMLVYKNQYGRNRWKYYAKKADILIPLEKYENKDIHENDTLSVPFNDNKYIFKKLDN